MKGAGTKCVIAPSFAFIYRRNTSNIGYPAIELTDESFYHKVDELGDEAVVEVNFETSKVSVGGSHWEFTLAPLEISLLRSGGMIKAYESGGSDMYKQLLRS